MSKFDPNALLHTELQVDTISTEFVNIPEGTFPIQLGAPKIESGEKNGKTWARLELPVRITDPNVGNEMGLKPEDEVKSYFTLFLDLDQDTGALDFGVNKNVKLGRLLQAVGLEGAAALASLEGRTALGVFKQRMTENNQIRTGMIDVVGEDE